MSTPTRYQQWTQPLLIERVGMTEPQEPDPDPSDPTDYADVDEGGAVQVGIDVGSVALIQEATNHTNSPGGSATATFGATPEIGNMLFAALFVRGTTAAVMHAASNPGWTQDPETPVGSTAGDGGRFYLWYKTAGASEPTSIRVDATDAMDLYIAEWSGLDSLDVSDHLGAISATTSMVSGSITPTSSDGLLLAAFVQAARNASLALDATYTEQMDVDVDPSGPSGVFGTKIVDPFTGSYSTSATSDKNEGYGWYLGAYSAAGGGVVWFPGPAANDGDTGTSAFSDSTGPCLRVALDVERLIYRISLDVGQASAGATVYELYGTNDATFAAPTLLATLSFTATGSYTLDTVDVSWVPTATYLYFQLEHVSGGGADREFYEVHLYSAVDVTGGVTSHPALTERDDPEQHPADAIELDPAVDGETDVQGGLENHETRIDALEAAGGGSDVDAVDVDVDTSGMGTSADPNAQALFDELYDSLFGVDTLGSLTAGGSPVSVVSGTDHNAFPGLAFLGASRVLLVFSGQGSSHEANHSIVGMIGTLAADHQSVASWGTEFVILNDTEDLRVEDGVSVVDGQLVIAYRYYDGADNHDPSLLICDDAPTAFTAASTWSAPIPLPDPGGTVQKYTQGYVHKLANGTYLLGGGFDSGGAHTVGVWRWTASLDDPSAAAFVTVASGADDFAEIAVEELTPGNLLALVRSVTDTNIQKNTSANSGATWAGVTAGYDGYGYPTFRKLQSGLGLTVYRDAPDGDNAWRPITSGMTVFGSETILDTTGTRGTYATLLQLTPYKILCVYSVEGTGSPATDGDIYSQIFTDSSTFGPSVTIDLSDTVTDETTWGITPDAGVSTEASRGDHTHGSPEEPSGTGGVGPILISDTHSTPLVFADLLQNEAGDDLLYDDA